MNASRPRENENGGKRVDYLENHMLPYPFVGSKNVQKPNVYSMLRDPFLCKERSRPQKTSKLNKKGNKVDMKSAKKRLKKLIDNPY